MTTTKFAVESLTLTDKSKGLYKLVHRFGEMELLASQIQSTELSLSGCLCVHVACEPDIKVGDTIPFTNARGIADVLSVSKVERTTLSTYYWLGRGNRIRVHYVPQTHEFLECSAH